MQNFRPETDDFKAWLDATCDEEEEIERSTRRFYTARWHDRNNEPASSGPCAQSPQGNLTRPPVVN